MRHTLIIASFNKNITRLYLLVLLFFGQSSFGQTDTSFGKPIFWYRVSDPWAMFMGAEGPVFILYESGKILFWKNGAYRLTQTTKQENEEIISDLSLNDTLFIRSRFVNAIDPNNEIVCCDQPSYTISVRKDTINRISVLGSINNRIYRKRFPDKFLADHDFIVNFDDDKAIRWIPEKFEVLLSDYSHSPDTPIQWPTNWPDLNSPDTRRQEGFVTSIFLDKKYFSQLTKLIKKRREKQAFEINGRKYFIGYRFPIPGLY